MPSRYHCIIHTHRRQSTAATRIENDTGDLYDSSPQSPASIEGFIMQRYIT